MAVSSELTVGASSDKRGSLQFVLTQATLLGDDYFSERKPITAGNNSWAPPEDYNVNAFIFVPEVDVTAARSIASSNGGYSIPANKFMMVAGNAIDGVEFTSAINGVGEIFWFYNAT